MNTEKPDSESLWTKAPVANLVRYEPSGIYFARAKVRGKLIRKSLDTNVLSVAKLRLADVLSAEHKAVAPSSTKIIGKMLFSDALAIFRERQGLATDIKDTTKEYNDRAADDLLKTWPGLEQMDVKRITKIECLEWRAKFGKMYSPTVTNGTLSILRRVLDITVEAGARYDNPAIVGLPLRRKGFSTETLFSEEMVLALHPEHPLTFKRTIFKEDLFSEKLILSQEGLRTGGCPLRLCKQNKLSPRIMFRSGQLDTIQSLVAAGKGISIIPQTAITETPAAITFRKLANSKLKRSIVVVTRNNRPLKPSALTFLEHLRSARQTFKLPIATNENGGKMFKMPKK